MERGNIRIKYSIPNPLLTILVHESRNYNVKVYVYQRNQNKSITYVAHTTMVKCILYTHSCMASYMYMISVWHDVSITPVEGPAYDLVGTIQVPVDVYTSQVVKTRQG